MSVSSVNTSATILVTMQMTNITSKEKQNLLFDTRPSGLCYVKIKVEWLVSLKIVKVGCYKDSSNHTHSLLDVDRLKRSQVIRTLVKKEAVKNYLPLAITATIKEYATIELGLDASAQELKRKKVTNIKYKVRGPMEVHLVGNSDLKLDISQSVSYLKEQGYQVEIYRVH
ncbi:hypothetical protein C1646_753125 [Rhizophagus diaphanus]|nr:hypothetical protein C1646_753125 [Rhizophagus diaphanus] [Rhizophagus sp. MUCL 43196]